MTTFLAALQLTLTAARRMVWSRQTMVSLLLLVMVGLACVAWSLRGDRPPSDFLNQVLLPLYIAFLLPMSCLGYATVGVAGDREEGTLVYLLATPLPRPLIYTAKYIAALVLTLIWTLGGLYVLGQAAGPAGREAVAVAWPAVLLATLAYVSLFQLFGALFRRATIVALGYALFLEVFLGNMPGIVKRAAITFYTQCLLFDAAAPLGVSSSGPHNAAIFQPIAADTAQTVLIGIAIGLFLLGAAVFTRREYH
jgi:ABC-type transport system involved in multi-copper enzyme maturation permease subunit